MKEILTAIEIIRKFDIMDFDLCVSQFKEYTNQNIPSWIIRRFKSTGLSNTDFITSDFLINCGYKNLYQFENDKEK
jgi:DNA polymerase III delta subunit